jgi:outer membrane protein assembly factor BamB
MLHQRVILAAMLALAACVSPVDSTSGGGPPRIKPSALLVWGDSVVNNGARPVSDDRAVYTQSFDHRVSAVDKLTGKLLWQVHLPFNDSFLHGTGLALSGGRLVVGDIDVYGLNPVDGSLAWTYQPSVGLRPGFQRLTADNATVYCGSVTGHLYGVDAATGAERWATQLVTDTLVRVFDPVFSNGVVYVGYSVDRLGVSQGQSSLGGAAAVDAATGRLLWSRLLPQPDPSVQTATYEVGVAGAYVLAASADGNVYALDRQTGEVKVTLPAQLFTLTPPIPKSLEQRVFATSGDVVLVGSSEASTVTALAASDLHRLWITTFTRGAVFDLVADTQRVYATYLGGQVGVFGLTDGKVLWWIDRYDLRPTDGLEGILFGPRVDGNRLYLGGQFEVYAMRTQ